MHTMWKGAISFGLVHVPIKMFAATEDKNVHFRQLHERCSQPISYAKTCRHCDVEVKNEEIIRGFEYEKDKFVVFNDEELEAIKPEFAKTIQILDFVDLSEIDPIYYKRPYYLSPDQAGAGAYRLLLEAIKQTGKIGIANIAIRSKGSLAALRVVDDCLCLETMHYPDEIREISRVPNLPEATPVNDKELDMAKLLVEQLSTPFEPTKYTDEYRNSLLDAIQDKVSGAGVDVITSPAAEQTKVVDLMAALQASLEATKPGAQKKTSAKKTATTREKETVS